MYTTDLGLTDRDGIKTIMYTTDLGLTDRDGINSHVHNRLGPY